ncbi:MAG TPA: NUDIX domain-containing protein [Phycisphaerae bacterium]|nr:NUDIX domain-containing protein [Phycisphaerae bacterium]
MPIRSAGILLYRRGPAGLEVFLAHLGGPYFARKDEHAWSIPKGVINPGEPALAAAQREFREETGLMPTGRFHELKPVRQAGGKVIHAWAVEGDCEPAALRSNTFEIEWPPRSGLKQSFPEVDRAGWFTVEEARLKMIKGQIALLDELQIVLSARCSTQGPMDSENQPTKTKP